MKRFLPALLLLVLLLCGCGADDHNPESTPTMTPAVTESTPTEPVLSPGTYDPDSLLEAETCGGVKVFPLGMKL